MKRGTTGVSKCCQWGFLDWKGISAGEITKRVTGKVQSGSIVLFHNAASISPCLLAG